MKGRIEIMFTNFIEFIEAASRMSVEALLNGLWQGVALTVVIWTLVKIAPRLHPRGRFAIWAATLAVIVGLPFVTGQKLLPPVIAKYFITGDDSEYRATEHLEATHNHSNHSAKWADNFPDSPQKLIKAPVVGLSSTRNLATLLLINDGLTPSKTRQSDSTLNRATIGDASKADNSPKLPLTSLSQLSDSPGNAVFSFVLSRSGAFLFLGIWLIISMALILRLAYSYWSLQSLQAAAVEAPEALQRRFAHWMHRQKITRDVRLLVSSDITVPLAVGFGSPAVIIPQTILASLSDDEFDLVFVHELAHLKRRDDWSVFWQQAAQALFFVNPATIWIARRMDFERELACDNEVVSFIGSPKKYAACLARLAELSTAPRHSALVAGTFIRKNRLVARVERLLNSASFGSSRSTRVTVSATFVLLLLALAQFTLIPAVVAVEEPRSNEVESAPRIVPIDRVEYSHVSDDSNNKRSYRKYKEQSRSAKEKIKALKSAMRDFKAKNQRITPDVRDRLDYYKDALREYEHELERINRSLERHSRSNRAYNARVSTGSDFVATPRFPASPSTPVAVSVAPRADRDGYLYSYSYAAPDVAAPLVTVKPVNPVVIVDAPRVSSSRRNSGINIAVPSFTIGDDGDWSFSNDDGEYSYNWSDGRHKIRVRAQGEFEFTDDETDIKSVSDEGFFTIRERGRGVEREYEVLSDEDGELDKTYYQDGRRSDIDDDAKEWIHETILFVLRNSNIGAKERVDRILDNDGAEGVLKEIGLMESDYVKRAYYSALFESGKMSSEQMREAVKTIGREIDSDYEKAQILSAIDEDELDDDATLKAYVEAVNTIDSDYDKRQSLGTVLSRKDLPKGVLLELMRAAESIDSDYERAELLRGLSESGLSDNDVVDAYAEAIAGIDSDYEKRRALEGITDRGDLSRETVLAILRMAKDIDSDYERAELLSDMSRYTKDDDLYAQAYYDAIVDIDSNYEKRRVLTKLLNRRTMNEALALKILALAGTIDSDYERAELLIDLSRFDEGRSDFGKAYIASLRGIDSEYEKHRVLAKLDVDESTDKEVLLDVLGVIDGFDSDFEKAGALKKIAMLYSKDDSLNDAFMDVVDGIDSDYDRDSVLAALYKAERSSRRARSRSGSAMD